MKKKVLIVTKDPRSKGGVVNYYNVFFEKYSYDKFDIEWFTIGSRSRDYYRRRSRKIAYFIEYSRDVHRFVNRLAEKDVEIVQLNPSLFHLPLVRDLPLLLISKYVFRLKVIMFIRGWSRDFAESVTHKFIWSSILRLWNRADATIILANKFRKVLGDLGFRDDSIHVTRTMGLLGNQSLNTSFTTDDEPRFLFLSRISKVKGIKLILESAEILRGSNLKFSINIYGHFDSENTKQEFEERVRKSSLQHYVIYHGFVKGSNKDEALRSNDVLLLPTLHDEGCPNTVIEGLLAGNYVLSSNVGALDEIIQQDITGSILEEVTTECLSNKMKWVIENITHMRNERSRRASFSEKQFSVEKMMGNIYDVYDSLLCDSI